MHSVYMCKAEISEQHAQAHNIILRPDLTVFAADSMSTASEQHANCWSPIPWLCTAFCMWCYQLHVQIVLECHVSVSHASSTALLMKFNTNSGPDYTLSTCSRTVRLCNIIRLFTDCMQLHRGDYSSGCCASRPLLVVTCQAYSSSCQEARHVHICRKMHCRAYMYAQHTKGIPALQVPAATAVYEADLRGKALLPWPACMPAPAFCNLLILKSSTLA